MTERYTNVWPIRFTDSQLATLKAAGAATDRPIAQFVRWATVKAAREVLATQEKKKGKRDGSE